MWRFHLIITVSASKIDKLKWESEMKSWRHKLVGSKQQHQKMLKTQIFVIKRCFMIKTRKIPTIQKRRRCRWGHRRRRHGVQGIESRQRRAQALVVAARPHVSSGVRDGESQPRFLFQHKFQQLAQVLVADLVGDHQRLVDNVVVDDEDGRPVERVPAAGHVEQRDGRAPHVHLITHLHIHDCVTSRIGIPVTLNPSNCRAPRAISGGWNLGVPRVLELRWSGS